MFERECVCGGGGRSRKRKQSTLSVIESPPTSAPLLLLLLWVCAPPPNAIVAVAWIAECLIEAIAVRSSIGFVMKPDSRRRKCLGSPET